MYFKLQGGSKILFEFLIYFLYSRFFEFEINIHIPSVLTKNIKMVDFLNI